MQEQAHPLKEEDVIADLKTTPESVAAGEKKTSLKNRSSAMKM
jgi:hypothetical protein